MAAVPEWLGYFELTAFVSMVGYGIYNRILTYRAIERRTIALEVAFSQYQKDIQHYLEVCELCRGEVRHHHEDEQERHVTDSMTRQIDTLVKDVADIKKFLMEHTR
jgi:hypothetical protein